MNEIIGSEVGQGQVRGDHQSKTAKRIGLTVLTDWAHDSADRVGAPDRVIR
jgi:hypothetical protein